MTYLDVMSINELKAYIRALYALPLSDLKQRDRDNIREAKEVLLAKGYQTLYHRQNNVNRITFKAVDD